LEPKPNEREVLKMKRNRYSSILALYAFACIVLFSAAAGLAAVETSITGTVYADDWDDKGNVTLVVIETADGEIYYVSDDAKGKELLKLVDKSVKVTGVVEDTGGEKTVTVMVYEIME
jgi:hypothetical protein